MINAMILPNHPRDRTDVDDHRPVCQFYGLGHKMFRTEENALHVDVDCEHPLTERTLLDGFVLSRPLEGFCPRKPVAMDNNIIGL